MQRRHLAQLRSGVLEQPAGGATEMLKGGASLWKERRRSSEHQKHISEGLDSLLVYVEGSWAPERGEHLPEVTHR